jgi:hypothetical protein
MSNMMIFAKPGSLPEHDISSTREKLSILREQFLIAAPFISLLCDTSKQLEEGSSIVKVYAHQEATALKQSAQTLELAMFDWH